MDHTLGLNQSVTQLYQSFTSKDYWEDLVREHQRHTDAELTTFASGDTGTTIVFTHRISRKDFPSFMAAAVPFHLVVTRKQYFEPFNQEKNCAAGYYTVEASVRIDIGGTYVLQQKGPGCEMLLSNTCTVKIPLVGSKFEQWLIHNLRQLLDGERDFTEKWVAQHY